MSTDDTYYENTADIKAQAGKVVLYDIETSPVLIEAWGTYETNALEVVREQYILTVSYKWLGEDETHVIALPDYEKTYRVNPTDDSELIKALHALFSEADVIVAHNGDKFDQKKSNARFLKAGLPPPRPYATVDTLKLARKYFSLPSKRLAGLGEADRNEYRRYYVEGPEGSLAWGLIGGKASISAPKSPHQPNKEIGGMVQRDTDPSKVVGYTHGMIQAIYNCVATGPWCSPFEIAVGKETKKLASCFPCSLFMYAAGYPPSAIHVDAGESWVPYYPVDPGTEGYSLITDEAIRSANTRWHLECWQHIKLGVEIMRADQADNDRIRGKCPYIRTSHVPWAPHPTTDNSARR